MKVSYMETLFSKSPITKDVGDIIQLIKSDNPDKNIVERCRQIGKGNPGYKERKESLPAVIFSGVFINRTNISIQSMSGLVFLDFDQIHEADLLESFKKISCKSYVYACWKSVSGKGYSVLAKADGLIKENYISAIKQIEKDLELVADKKAMKLNQPCFISFDPDMYINESCSSFIINPEISTSEEGNKKRKSTHPLEGGNSLVMYASAFAENPGRKIKYKTVFSKEEYADRDYIYLPQGFPYTEIYINQRRKLIEGERNNVLLIISNKLLYLNSFLNRYQLKQELMKINKMVCIKPLGEEEIEKMASWSYDRLHEGNLFVTTTTRYISFNPFKRVDTRNKKSISGKISGIRKREKTLNNIEIAIAFIKDQNQKVTQKRIADIVGLSERTIRNYWKDLNLKKQKDPWNPPVPFIKPTKKAFFFIAA